MAQEDKGITMKQLCKRIRSGQNGIRVACRGNDLGPDILDPKKVMDERYSEKMVAKIANAMGLEGKGQKTT